jgi:uncharacterized protein YkwD
VTRPPIAIAAAAPMLLSAALALPANAAPAAHSRTPTAPLASSASYSSAHAKVSHGRRIACRARSRGTAARRASCRADRAKGLRRVAIRSSERTPAARRAAALQASIAQVLATPCQNTNLTPTPANIALLRGAVLCLVNVERARHGEEPLRLDRHLEAAAESHGKEMLAENYFEHVSPSGETPVDRVRETGYIPNSEVGYVVGENLAWGTLSLSTPEAIVNAWIASPEHLANILEAKYQDTGIDVEPALPSSLVEGVEGGLYTQEFGTIAR